MKDANDIHREHGIDALRTAFDFAPLVSLEELNDSTVEAINDHEIETARNAKAAVHATPYEWRDPASLPRREWLHGRHLIRQFVSSTIAPGGVGKSSLAIVEALEMVAGKGLLSSHEAPPLRVWYWNGEDPTEEIARRVQAACLHYGIARGDIAGRLFIDSGRDTEIIVAREVRGQAVIAEPLIANLKATIERNRIDALIVDPFVACHAVGENDNGKIALVARLWAQIAEVTNCAIDLVHHARKSGGGELTAEDARGASALIAATRSARVLNRMTKEEAERAGVEEHRRYFRIDDGKRNLAPPEEVSTWRRLETVSLGNGLDGRPDDHVGVVTAWTWPNPFDEVSVGDLREVQKRIATGDWREDVRAKEWAGNAVAEVLSLDLTVPSVKKDIARILATWIKNGALRVEERADSQRHKKRFVMVGEFA